MALLTIMLLHLRFSKKKHALTLWLLVVTPEQRVKIGTLLNPIVVHSNPSQKRVKLQPVCIQRTNENAYHK